MQFFKYKIDRIPITIFVSLFILDLSVYFLAESKLFITIWMLVFLWPKVIICSWNHHHQHLNTFNQKFLNRLIELVFAFHTGAMPNMWVLHHNLGHHLNYLDQSKDPSRWKDKEGHKMGRIRYAFEVAITSFYRAYQVGKKFPDIQKTYLVMTFLVFSLLILMIAHKPFNATFIFLIPMFHSLLFTAETTYKHHSGLESHDPYCASRNITDKLYNFLTGNLGFHTAHHLKFGAHWSKLPKIHEEIKDKIPQELIEESRYFNFIKKFIPIRGV